MVGRCCPLCVPFFLSLLSGKPELAQAAIVSIFLEARPWHHGGQRFWSACVLAELVMVNLTYRPLNHGSGHGSAFKPFGVLDLLFPAFANGEHFRQGDLVANLDVTLQRSSTWQVRLRRHGGTACRRSRIIACTCNSLTVSPPSCCCETLLFRGWDTSTVCHAVSEIGSFKRNYYRLLS